ncbi:MAG: GNAT family N-acetyltransferase [Flavicella sp.]
MITLKKYSPKDQKKWDTFCDVAKNATFLFKRDFMDYHANRFEDFSLLLYKDATLIALLPANRVDSTLYSHQGLTYGGFIIGQQLKFSDYIALFCALLEYLNEEGVSSFVLKKLPSFYTSIPSDEIEYVLQLLTAKRIRSDISSLIALQYPKKVSKIRLRGVKKALKNKLEVQEETNFKAFWEQVLIPNLKDKHGVHPVHSLEEIQLLKQRFPENIRQFSVYHGNTIVGGTTIFEMDTVVHAQYISAHPTLENLGSLDLLFDHLIRNVFPNKTYFDFGISTEQKGRKLNKGLLGWKEGFGARATTYDTYEINPQNHTKLSNLYL